MESFQRERRVRAAAILGAQFSDTSLPPGWTLSSLAAGGAAVVANSIVTVDGAALLSPTTYGWGRSFEFRTCTTG